MRGGAEDNARALTGRACVLADGDEIRAECKALRNEISEFRNKIMVEIQTHDKNITSTTLVLHMLQEIEQIAVETRRIIMEMRKFAELT